MSGSSTSHFWLGERGSSPQARIKTLNWPRQSLIAGLSNAAQLRLGHRDGIRRNDPLQGRRHTRLLSLIVTAGGKPRLHCGLGAQNSSAEAACRWVQPEDYALGAVPLELGNDATPA